MFGGNWLRTNLEPSEVGRGFEGLPTLGGVILDPEHKLVDVTGATITPEAVVITPEAVIVYRGRIDDWYSDLGERRRAPRTSELSAAIDAVLKGEKPETQVTSAIGCFIADFRRPAEK